MYNFTLNNIFISINSVVILSYVLRIPIDLRHVFTPSVRSVLMDYLYRKRTTRKDGSVPSVTTLPQKTSLKLTHLSVT